MSMMMSGPAAGGLPQGELLATYSTYEQAREQVDRLAEADFPVTALSIVGKDLRVVERVRGRLNYGRVALGAAVQGALFGAMIGAFLLLLDSSAGGMQIVTSALLGVAVWVIFGVVGFASRKGRHGFASTQALVPGGYDLVVAFEHAGRARQELGLGARGAATPAPAPMPVQESAPAPAPAPAPSGSAVSGPSGSHAAPASSAEPAPAHVDGPAQDPAAPAGLDRSYGVTLPPEEVARLIEARGGRPRQDPQAPQGQPHPWDRPQS
ncbi:hypothetical protein KW076_06405 [Micrococcus porci]|uniref:general stress protein n=1 Tax=Micrococcus porci TaxID=2856555 RepID=UPI001CCBB724|nr:general stress protein [Micrococcus porci]UBH25796.1 hypothetical protein KW076_06405 [Micrococcus porci]